MSGTQSVLDQMTAQIVARKQEAVAGSGLTPVGLERRGPLDGKQPTAFPFDQPDTVKTAIITALRRLADVRAELDHVQQGVLVIGGLYGIQPAEMDGPPDANAVVDAQKAAEREADRKARERDEAKAAIMRGVDRAEAELDRQTQDYADKARAAQAAVLGPGGTLDATPKDPLWSCPTHGSASVEPKPRRRGGTYLSCTKCGEFEKR